MMISTPTRILVVVVTLACTSPALAERFRVCIGAMPVAYVNDSATYCGQLGSAPRGVEPAVQLTTEKKPVATVQAPTGALAPDRSRAGCAIMPLGPESILSANEDADTFDAPPDTPPAPEFIQDLAGTYNITDPADVTVLWKWYVKEPPELSNGEKTGNAVVHQILANGGPLVPTSSARVDGLKPAATRGTVRSRNGVVARQTPWGKTGKSLALGTAVNIVPPANGVWYNVEGVGWVPGLWLDLQ